ncbi:MAG: chromosomal replication initiator protein DnaA [Kiritimatiellia bacterium]|jgi:chromosomal replication initiator protein
MASAESIWKKCCIKLKKKLHEDIYSRWIAVISAGRIESDTMVLYVSNDIYQSWLEENYLPVIQETVAEVSGEAFNIIFEVNQNAELPLPVEVAPDVQSKSAPTRRAASSSSNGVAALGGVLNPKYSFKTFVIGPSNNFAHASSLAVAQAPGKAYNPLFIYGGVGLGKTHLMQAIGHEVLTNFRGHIHYLSCESLMNEYIEALQHRRIKQFRDKYRGTDLLMIDDIHFLSKTGALQEEFFHTFNVLYDAHKQIVMTSDRPIGEISGLEQRLVSRFEWGLVTELMPPDFETRMAILRSKQKTLNFTINEDVLVFIASNIKSNIRRLEGALNTITSYAALYKRPITINIAEDILSRCIDREHRNPITISMIQKQVAEFFDIRMADMTSKQRSQNVALPRQIAMYLCRRMTKSSFPEIGAAFGKTHATALHAHRCIEKRSARDKQINQAVERILRQLEDSSVAGIKS